MKIIQNLDINNKTILILELYPYHSECSPGFSKYLIDLGFYVDIIMDKYGKDSFNLFEFKDKIRLITYNYSKKINFAEEKFKFFFRKYSFIIVQTVDNVVAKTVSYIDLLCDHKVIFVFHFTKYYKILNFKKIENQKRIWFIGHFSIGLYINPHYIGKIKLKNKNNKTRFFVVSTIYRNYNYLVSAALKLKEENIDFDVIVVGKIKRFEKNHINKEIMNNFIFHYNVTFSELYKEVDNSDYIIITLDPDNKKDLIFRNQRATGSIQLSYGFKKPVLIHKEFSSIYNMTEDNSFLFNKNNFYNVMKEAILLNNEKYKIKQRNLIKLSNLIYKTSLENVNKTVNSLLYKL